MLSCSTKPSFPDCNRIWWVWGWIAGLVFFKNTKRKFISTPGIQSFHLADRKLAKKMLRTQKRVSSWKWECFLYFREECEEERRREGFLWEGFFCVRRMARGKEREGGDNNEQVATFNWVFLLSSSQLLGLDRSGLSSWQSVRAAQAQ